MLRQHLNLMVSVGLAALLCAPSIAGAQTAPSLGTAAGFAVLGATTVTNTGSSVIDGNVGVSPGSAITGFPPGTITGTFHGGDATALQAQNDVTTAFNSLASQPCTADLTGQNLGNRTLTPGVYCFSSSAQLTGTLTLNALGNPNAVFIFRTGSTLITASNASVVMNGGQSCNVFWQVGSSATLGTATTFVGNILAQASITLTTGARVDGRTLARTGAVTLDTNNVERTLCAAAPPPPPPPPPPCPPISLAPATLPDGTVGVAYNQVLVGSGGTAPYTFTLITGSLPQSMTLTPAGVLAGTPTAAGTSTVTIRATDANGCFIERAYTVIIAAAPAPPPSCPPIVLSPSTAPNGTVGVAYSQQFTASGGTGPYVFGTSALPAGLTLTPSGLLAGTPTAASSSTFIVRATDAAGCFIDVSYTIVVAAAPVPPPTCPPITLSPATLPNATVGVFHTLTITGSGGTAPYVFGVTAGALPLGVTLTPGGVLSGTPTTAGTSTFTIRGTDANGCFAELTYTVTVAVAVPTLTQWAMISLVILLGLAGYMAILRRQGVATML